MFQAVISTATFILVAVVLVKIYLIQRNLRRRNEELELKLKDAEGFLVRHGKLANEVAHEIKNPITAILCSAEALDLLLGPGLAEDHRKTLSYIKEYGDNLLRLVSNFIDVSRADTGNISNNPEPTAVVPLLESVTGLLAASAERKEIALKVVSTGNPSKVLVDPVHLKQIVFNLVHNAIKFTPRRGEIHIHVESDFPNPYLRIAVKDNGYGISSSRLGTLFDPYSRYDGYASMAYPAVAPGVGLGLALCKRLVELAGGELTVESQLNVGTSFEFTLPIAQEIERGETSKEEVYEHCRFVSSGTEQPLTGQTFLILNKTADAAAPIRQLIIAWGGKVDLAGNADDALRAAQEKTYDAIMLDEELEGADLHSLVERLRRGVRSKETTLILAGDRCQPSDGAFDRILSKPFNGKVLLEALLASGKHQVAH